LKIIIYYKFKYRDLERVLWVHGSSNR